MKYQLTGKGVIHSCSVLSHVLFEYVFDTHLFGALNKSPKWDSNTGLRKLAYRLNFSVESYDVFSPCLKYN